MTRLKFTLHRIPLVFMLSLAFLTSGSQAALSQKSAEGSAECTAAFLPESDSGRVGGSGSYPAQAQSSRSQSSTLEAVQFRFAPPSPPSQGAPSGRRRGGASRGPCQKYEALTALVPDNEGFVWGLTAAEHPRFLFFVPEGLTAELPVEFVLQDEADNYIYRTTFTGSQMQPGVVSLSVPPTTTPLEIGKLYYWTFSIYCDLEKPSNSVFVQGWVQRVALEPQLQRQLEAATLLERITLYAAKGIWHDPLTLLAQLRHSQSNDLALDAAWTDLLEQVGLAAIASEPIIDCCTTENKN